MRSTYNITVAALKEAKRRFSEDKVRSDAEASASITRHLHDAVLEAIDEERERCAKWAALLGKDAVKNIRLGTKPPDMEEPS